MVPVSHERGTPKRQTEMQIVWGNKPAYVRITVWFFPWIFFPSKTNPPKYMEITSCELFQIQSLGLACVSWLRSSKAFLDRVLLPLKIPLTSLKDSFYKHIKKIKSSAKIYALQLGCEGQQQTQIDHDKYLKIMCLARYCYSKYTRNPNNSIAKKKNSTFTNIQKIKMHIS